MKINNTNIFKEKLEKELGTLEGELKTISRKNPDNKADWEPVPEKMDVLASDSNEVADSFEAFEENTAIVKQLEIRYNEVKAALARIKNKTYGVCQKCGEPVEIARLEANPAAITCMKHMK